MKQIESKKVLVLGASGMLGNAVLRYFSGRQQHSVVGSVRSNNSLRLLPPDLHPHIIRGVDAENLDNLTSLFASTRPDVVINCIGLVKQLSDANDPLLAIPINALLPHRLARLCAVASARLLHVSTDCVFSGNKGMYREDDPSDAQDLYGRSKYLGEVDYQHAITLRVSMIGHELNSAHGIVGWFLSQQSRIRGYTKAVFSGLPSVELARVMHDFVVPNDALHGIYHVSAAPIDKCSLLQEIAKRYAKAIDIIPDDKLVIDRSLDSTRFRSTTGYVPPTWPELVAIMHEFA